MEKFVIQKLNTKMLKMIFHTKFKFLEIFENVHGRNKGFAVIKRNYYFSNLFFGSSLNYVVQNNHKIFSSHFSDLKFS
jgi:hypothetical protein